MSWLNLNDSLNSLKGQITNFANNVLAEDLNKESTDVSNDLEELQRICVQQQEEIKRLREQGLQLTQEKNVSEQSSNHDDHNHSNGVWSWDSPKDDTSAIISDLKKTILVLENDKKELISNLELLDSEHQQNTEKLMNMKAKLQKDYNDLEDKYLEVEEEARKYKNELAKSKVCTNCEKQSEENQKYLAKIEKLTREVNELEDLCHKTEEEKLKLVEESQKNVVEMEKLTNKVEEESKIVCTECEKLSEENQKNLARIEKLTDEMKELENKQEKSFCNKCEKLLEENQKSLATIEKLTSEVSVLKSNSDTLAKILEDSRSSNDVEFTEINQKLKLSESENKILIAEIQKKTQAIEDFGRNHQKIALILEGYEQQVSALKKELAEKDSNEEKLREVETQLEAALQDKEQTHKRYVNILTENMKKLDNNVKNEIVEVDPQVSDFNHQVESLINILLDLKSKCETLERDLVNVTEEKTKILSEKNHEIERLIQNSEILSQEVITKSQTIKDYENECSELMKNNDILINEVEMLKNTSGLQTISETNEDNLLMMEAQLDTANRRIQELEELVASKDDEEREKLEKIKTDLENTEYQYTELNINMETLKEEIENQKKIVEEKEKQLVEFEDVRSELNVIREKLLLEEDSRKQLETQIRNLTEKLQNAKMCETSLKLQYDTISKELLSMTEAKSSVEASLKTTLTNLDQCRDDLLHLQKENEELKTKLETGNEDQSIITTLEKKIEELNTSRNELTNAIITKHQESVTYHNEIQRLSQILKTEMEKNSDVEKITDQNNFLRQKCEVLAQNLLDEQTKSQEKEQVLNKKLERLQSHLMEVEEHYTQELLRAEERNSELQAKVNEVEQREKDSSTMYTSVSIRANQHVETLQHQLQLITNQRDELRKKISDAEDNASKQEAALANLQFVLEQFQKEKENDVLKETERIRRQINLEKQTQNELRKEITTLQSQLEESKHGLLAASRLSDKLEQSKQLNVTLKTEVSQLKEKLQKSEEHLHSLSSQSDGKVDKSLIKNLVIGFVSTNNNLNKDQLQILKIIATVLDFNQQDHDKVNLNKPQQGWLDSLLGHPQTSSQESLSQAFVKFLENESKPRSVPSLLNETQTSSVSRKSSTGTGPRHSPNILSEVVLPTFADFAQNRNSSSILKDVLKDNS